MREDRISERDDSAWIDFPSGSLDDSRGAGPTATTVAARGNERPSVIVGCPMRPLGGGVRRRVVRITVGR